MRVGGRFRIGEIGFANRKWLIAICDLQVANRKSQIAECGLERHPSRSDLTHQRVRRLKPANVPIAEAVTDAIFKLGVSASQLAAPRKRRRPRAIERRDRAQTS